MDFWNLANIFIFLLQTTTGILGNLFLIFCYLVIYCRGCTLKPTDMILTHLTTADLLIVLSLGVPQTLAVLGFKHFLNEFGCKILVYIQGFGRSMSIGTTCLLSVFQALTICPRNSFWKEYKVKVEKNFGCHISLLWLMYIFINFIHFAYTLVNWNSKNVTIKRDFGFCCIEGEGVIGDSLYIALVVCPEVFFSVLMLWTSASMIVILYRHKQRVQHIHNTRGSRKKSPESRATQNILILVSTFLAFYTLSSILRGYTTLLYSHNWWLVNISRLASLCFPSFGPFVVINNYCFVARYCSELIRNKNHLISY